MQKTIQRYSDEMAAHMQPNHPYIMLYISLDDLHHN